MSLVELDYLAAHGRSALHRASPYGKLVSALVTIIAILTTSRLERLSLILAFLVLMLVLSGLHVRTLLHLLAAPLLFTGVFALAVQDATMLARLGFTLRSLGTAAALLLLISTTNMFDLIACSSRLLSPLVADALFVTCRALFLLVDRLSSLSTATRIKGISIPRKIVANLQALGGALGAALIRTLDLSERMRRILALRGYTMGSLPGPARPVTRWDAVPLLTSAALLGVALW